MNFLGTIGLKIITREFLRSLKKVVNSDFNLRWRIQYGGHINISPWKSGTLWYGKRENYYSMSVWGITTNLIANLDSAIENPSLQSHTWFFDRIHIIPYSFVRNILKGFSHLSCHKSFFYDSSWNLLTYTYSMIFILSKYLNNFRISIS